MKKNVTKSQPKLKPSQLSLPKLQQFLKSQQLLKAQPLPAFTSRQLIERITPPVSHKSILSSQHIQRSKKNLAMIYQLNPTVTRPDTSESASSVQLRKRLDSGKQSKDKILPSLVILKPNQDKKNYIKKPMIKQCLVGEQAVQLFYQRYKKLDRRKDAQQFYNQNHVITSIVALLQLHNFTPRKLSVVKLRGNQAILDLSKLGLGQGSLGPVAVEIINYLQSFQHVDLSYNRIDAFMAETIIERLGSTLSVDLSHNRIGRQGCQKFSQLWLSNNTRIQELNLQQNNLIDSAGVVLLQTITNYGFLRKLNLNKNFLGQKFAQEFKEYIGGARHLQEMYLSWNQFTARSVQNILQGVCQNSSLKVFDFSWNKINQDSIPTLAKIFQSNDNLVHVDFSFCQIRMKQVRVLAKALQQNHTLYGLHFEGNSGYIDHKGFLQQTQKQFHQYPLPIIQGVIRRISGVKPRPNNQFKVGHARDVCWICQSWQQKTIQIAFTAQMRNMIPEGKQGELYVHFQHQRYNGVRVYLNQTGDKFELMRMFPRGTITFFFTFVGGVTANKITFATNQYKSIPLDLNVKYAIGKIQFNQTIPKVNTIGCEYDTDPLGSKYDVYINCLPRDKQVWKSCIQGRKVEKQKIVREQKVQVAYKDLNEDDEFLKDKLDVDYEQEYMRRCIQFDIANSKISKLIKKEQMQQFKTMALGYYRNFKDIFYYLAHSNPNNNCIYSITQNDFVLFVDQQKYPTKRVTLVKLMLKMTACLSNFQEDSKGRKDDKNMRLFSRPQFMEVLIRIAIEKWCTAPIKKSDAFKEKDNNQEQDWKALKKKKNAKGKKEEAKPVEVEQPAVRQQQHKAQEQHEQGQEEDNQGKKAKVKLPLPFMVGIQKIMKSLQHYANNYRGSNWRKNQYLTVDIMVVLKAYDQFLRQLFHKYSQGKFYKTTKAKRHTNLMLLQQLKALLLDTDIRRSKQNMKDIQQTFLDAKRLQVQDGNVQYGLNYEQFQQCLARISRFVWFNPPAAPTPQLWQDQLQKKMAPLFLRFQALLNALYWRTPDLHTKRMSKILDKGIFTLEIDLIKKKIRQAAQASSNTGLLKMNSLSMSEGGGISLKQITQELRSYYDSYVVRHQYEEQVDVEEFQK